MSLTENSNQLFLPGGCNKLAKYSIYLSLAPTVDLIQIVDRQTKGQKFELAMSHSAMSL